MTSVHQFHPVLAPGDAMSDHVFALRARFRGWGYESEAYAVEATLKPLTALDPKSLQVLAARSVDPRLLVAMAFQDIAANAAKVGNLNISPDLLDTLLQRNGSER